MKTTTDLAKSLTIAKDKAAYDASCKRILANSYILAWILQSCVAEFKDTPIEIIAQTCIEGPPQISTTPVLPDEIPNQIHSLATEDKTLHEGTITYDLLFHAITPETKEPIQLLINVEAQKDDTPGYPLVKRGLYYCSRLISSQYGKEFTHSHYENIRKVYSIWICTTPAKKRQNTVTEYSITETPRIGNEIATPQHYDLFRLLILHLGTKENLYGSGILRLLSTIFSQTFSLSDKTNILETEFQLPMTTELENEVIHMCNLSDGVFEEGVAKGIAQGIAQGQQIGETKGSEKERLRNTIGMIQEGIDYAVISRITSYSIERITEIAKQHHL